MSTIITQQFTGHLEYIYIAINVIISRICHDLIISTVKIFSIFSFIYKYLFISDNIALFVNFQGDLIKVIYLIGRKGVYILKEVLLN